MTRILSLTATGVLGMVLIVAGAPAPAARSAPAPPQRAQDAFPAVAQEIEALVEQLMAPWRLPRDQTWLATARLQKIGLPAVAALVARLRYDTVRSDHGHHSPIQEALEKIGAPAVAEIGRVLTPALLSSRDPDDVAYVERATAVVARIGIDVDGAAALLVRVAGGAGDPRTRAQAFHGLIGTLLGPLAASDATGYEVWWETCTGLHWAACPFDTRSPRLAVAIRPVLADVEALVRREPDARARLAGAHVLARWGEGALRQAGEAHLLALVVNPGPSPYDRAQAIQALGLLGVTDAGDAIAAQAGASADEYQQLMAAQALTRLRHPASVHSVIDLMTAPTPHIRRLAMETARRSRDTTFVPALLEHVDDQSPNGVTRTSIRGDQRVETHMPIATDAVAALRALTFQSFGADAGAWRTWWASNGGGAWGTYLITFVEEVLPQMDTAEPWVMNEWMDRLGDAADPAVLPFVAAYLRHPRRAIGAVGPNETRLEGRTPAVSVLMALVGQGSSEARDLLYECMDAGSRLPSMECTRGVAWFDPRQAADRLAALLEGPSRLQAAERLLQLGDVRGLPALIDEIESVSGLSGRYAIRLLRAYTQEDIPYDPDAPADARQAAAQAWRQWWQGVQPTFVLRMREARIDTAPR